MPAKISPRLIICALLVLLSMSLSACNSEPDKECAHENTTATAVDVTCDSEGYTLNTCEDCGYEYKSDFVAPLGHDLSESLTAPTCTSEGFTSYSCERCDYAYTSNYKAPIGHSFSSAVTDPTCDKQGFTSYACKVCDFSYVADYIKPTGHTFTETTLHATSSSLGYTHYICECSYEYTDYVMPTDVFTGGFAESDTPLARGIDVSKWNGSIDWSAVKDAGFDFVIIKAGSVVGKDDKFEEHYAGAKAAGLDVGAYFYTYAKNLDEIDEEADMFLSWLEGKQFEYPVYLDIEDDSQINLGSRLLTDMCVRFMERLQSEGYFCGLYANDNWLFTILESERMTTYFDIWYARYKIENIEEWGDTWGERLAMWQFTSTGKIGDHTCDFDINLVYKDYPTLIKEWGYNGYTAQ